MGIAGSLMCGYARPRWRWFWRTEPTAEEQASARTDMVEHITRLEEENGADRERAAVHVQQATQAHLRGDLNAAQRSLTAARTIKHRMTSRDGLIANFTGQLNLLNDVATLKAAARATESTSRLLARHGYRPIDLEKARTRIGDTSAVFTELREDVNGIGAEMADATEMDALGSEVADDTKSGRAAFERELAAMQSMFGPPAPVGMTPTAVPSLSPPQLVQQQQPELPGVPTGVPSLGALSLPTPAGYQYRATSAGAGRRSIVTGDAADGRFATHQRADGTPGTVEAVAPTPV